VRQVLDELGESVEAIAYDPLGHYHFPDVTFPVYGSADRYKAALAQITPAGAAEYSGFERQMLQLYEGLRQIPPIDLRPDWKLIPQLLSRYPGALLKLLRELGTIRASVGDVMDRWVRDPWVRRLIDLECFLLSGLKAHGTVAPEVAFMLGERSHSVIDYPIGGSGAIVEALVRGFKKWGGELRLKAHVEQILIEQGQATGVRLKSEEVLRSAIVISNASIWDTYGKLLQPEDLPAAYRAAALATPTVNSFMHLHLGIRSEGLENLTGHHVVVHDALQDITVPGNTCMISIPSVWDKNLAPPGHLVVHAYTLEPYDGWQRDDTYKARKRQKAEPLYRALEKIIPDLRGSSGAAGSANRIVLELVGTPLTHAYYLRRHQGTYGAAIDARTGLFPPPQTPIRGLYRVGDSTLPGIGVPAAAASGVLCANLVGG
jgi:phytoene dehydrogenase-like protein